eukprot:1449740-Rhodomonas_salina.2
MGCQYRASHMGCVGRYATSVPGVAYWIRRPIGQPTRLEEVDDRVSLVAPDTRCAGTCRQCSGSNSSYVTTGHRVARPTGYFYHFGLDDSAW